MRNSSLNACDPYSFTLGKLVRPEPVKAEPAPVLVHRQCVTAGDAKRIGYSFDGLVQVSREWRNGVLVGTTYGPALDTAASFIAGSTEPMPCGVVETPAAVLTRAELTALAEQAAYMQAQDRGEPHQERDNPCEGGIDWNADWLF